MFASQLLRILQTVPADVNYETRVIDIPAVKFTMKEYQDKISSPANCSENEADYLAFKIDNGNASQNVSVPGLYEASDRSSNSDGKEDSLKLGDHEGSFHLSNGSKRSFESLAVSDQSCSSPEVEHSTVTNGFSDLGEKGAAEDSQTLCTSVSEVKLNSQTNPFLDEIVRECELPEVTVCYKDSNYHIVKDICVDEGLPTHDKTLIEIDNDSHTESFFSQLCAEDGHNGTAKGGNGMDSCPDGFEESTGEHLTNYYFGEEGTKEVNVETYFLDGSKPTAEVEVEDVSKMLGPEKLEQVNEENSSATERTEDELDNGSRHSSLELVTEDAHHQSSNHDEIEAPRQSDEIPSVEAILESLAMAFTSDDAKKNVAEGNLQYNSKVEGGTITFNFDSSEPSLASDEAESTENSREESPKENGKHGDVDDKPATTVPARESNAENNKNAEEPKTLSQNAADDPVRLHRGGGETSFSSNGPVSGLITYSGPIAYSGSISLRSDSSTTSTRSFAFPVLQSEWNSSPVRMVKADRRHFRKHRGWRQGLFCCRF